MATVVDAIQELIPDEEWTISGEPESEAEFNAMFRRVIGVKADGSAVLSDNPDNWGVSWATVIAKRTELEIAEPLKLLRAERTRRLAETDWWASSDLKMTQAQTGYRQALRDITNTYQNLNEVVWPDKPE